MPQAGFDPPAQSDNSYEADALPPSHHGWIKTNLVKRTNFNICYYEKFDTRRFYFAQKNFFTDFVI